MRLTTREDVEREYGTETVAEVAYTTDSPALACDRAYVYLNYAVPWRFRELARAARGVNHDGVTKHIPGSFWTALFRTYHERVNPGKCAVYGSVGEDPISRAHIRLSEKQPGMITYTPSDEYGEADRQITSSIGKTLRKIAPDVFSDAEIADLSALLRVTIEPPAIQIAKTAERIEYVYRNGPHTCMSGDASRFSTRGVHPTVAYSYGSVGVAYTMRDDRITSRAVVDEARKVYSRPYGDCIALEEGLRARGYARGDLAGSCVAKIEVPDCVEAYVMPYVDSYTGVSIVAVDRGDHFELMYNGHQDAGDDYYYAHETGGYIGEPVDECICAHCGSAFCMDDGGIVTDSGDDVCDACSDEYVVDQITGEWIHRGDAVEVFDRERGGWGTDSYFVHECWDPDAHKTPRGEWFDSSLLNGAGYYVLLADGDVIETEEAIYISGDGYYREEDCVWVEALDEHYLLSDEGFIFFFDENGEAQPIARETANNG